MPKEVSLLPVLNYINCSVLHYVLATLVLIVLYLIKTIFTAPRSPPPPGKIWTVDSRNGDMEWKKTCPPKTGDKYAVIGVGLLGTRIVRRLLERDEEVVAIDIRALDHIESEKNLTKLKGSVTDMDFLKMSLKGIDTVFLTASHNGFFDNHIFQYPPNHDVDVTGTENVLSVCMTCGVKRLIFTSSAAIVLDAQPVKMNLDEYTEYSSSPLSHYARTKIQAEKSVLLSHNKGNLHTSCVRPCTVMFGEGHQDFEKILARKKNTVWFGNSITDYTYVDNVVMAELLIEKKMRDFRGLQQVGGYTFCISNDQPMSHWEFNLKFKHFYPELRLYSNSDAWIWLVCSVMELWLVIFGGLLSLGDSERRCSYVRAQLVSQSSSFRIDRAREMLDYKPVYTVDEGIYRMVNNYKERHQKKKKLE